MVTSVTLWYSIYVTSRDERLAWEWAGIAIALVIIPAILFIAYNLRRRAYTDSDVSVREHRFGLYFFIGICEILCLALLVNFSAPRILIACFATALLALMAISLINTRTKISVHAAASSACAMVFFLFSPQLGVIGGLASLGVGWSRVYLHHHTFAQVILGWTIAVTTVLLVFVLLLRV
jgi:membrane-associated phospholipid phosphatase